jgi:hypothetical protein
MSKFDEKVKLIERLKELSGKCNTLNFKISKCNTSLMLLAQLPLAKTTLNKAYQNFSRLVPAKKLNRDLLLRTIDIQNYNIKLATLRQLPAAKIILNKVVINFGKLQAGTKLSNTIIYLNSDLFVCSSKLRGLEQLPKIKESLVTVQNTFITYQKINSLYDRIIRTEARCTELFCKLTDYKDIKEIRDRVNRVLCNNRQLIN